MLLVLILIAVVAIVAAGLYHWRSSDRASAAQTNGAIASTAIEARPEFPSSGLLVPEEVLQASGSTSVAIWDALEAAATPVAIEYRPVSQSELVKFRLGPINATAQQAMVDVVKALDPNGPTLFRVVLPKGAELVKAVGTEGFRGFSRTGGKTAHAVLKPVAAGGAIAAGWPVLAVAGTVMAVDMVTQREQLAHQRRVETLLGRHEERYYVDRITAQRSADAQLSRAISLMLDGRDPHMELAIKSAQDEFHRAQQFLDKHRDVIDDLLDDDGKVDYHRLDQALGGRTKDVEYFIRELHLARAAVAIKRKALVADAAAGALADPSNPYRALQKFLNAEVLQLEQADAAVTELTERLALVELKGRRHNRAKSVAERQTLFRAQIAPPAVDGDVELQYVLTESGEILQLLPAEEGDPDPPATADS
jgi:hypothetical protein